MKKRSNPKIKAWEVRDPGGDCEPGESCLVIIFHHRRKKALEIGADQMGVGAEHLEVEHRPGFDRYADQGYVPRDILLEQGWWFECCFCYRWIQRENEDIKEVVIDGREIYCNETCRVKQAAKIRVTNEDFEEFKKRLQKDFPFLEWVEFKGGYPIENPVGYFTFSGAKHHGRARLYRNGRLGLTIANKDIKAWGANKKVLKEKGLWK